MAEFFYQLGGYTDPNARLPINGGQQRLSTQVATPPDAPMVARSAHTLPAYKVIGGIEQMDLTALAKTDNRLKDLAVGDYIFTHFYVKGQAIVGLFANIDVASSAPGFQFDIVKVPSTYDANDNVIKDYANEVVLASDLSGDEVGEIVRRRAFIDDGLNTANDPDVDMGFTEAVAGEIGIKITGLPNEFDLCTQSPKFSISLIVEEPCYRDFVISKDRLGACGTKRG